MCLMVSPSQQRLLELIRIKRESEEEGKKGKTGLQSKGALAAFSEEEICRYATTALCFGTAPWLPPVKIMRREK